MFKLALLNNRFPALHGLRVLAVVLIVQVHMTSNAGFRKFPVGEGLAWYSKALWPGMDFFFVLSGFLIGTILFHALEKEKNLRIGRFYLRRSFRIFPLYYCCLFLISRLPQPQLGYPHHNGIHWKELLYLTNYPMDFSNVMYWSWSLSVEEHFYLAVPIVALALYRLRSPQHRLAFLGVLWASCFLVKATVVAQLGPQISEHFFTSIYFPTHTRYDALVAGLMAAYLNCTWPEQTSRLFKTRKVKMGVLLATCGMFSLAMANFSVGELIFREPVYYLKATLLVGTSTSLVFAALILWAVHNESKVLGHRYFHYLGTLSYGIYLMHIPVIELFVFPYILKPALVSGLSFNQAWCLGLLAALLAVTAVSYLLHLVIEKPMLLLRQKVCP